MATTRMMMSKSTMTLDDSWKDIEPPIGNANISARRVPDAGTHAWGLYWGVDNQRRPLLILQHQSEHLRSRRLPKLHGLRVEAQSTEDHTGERLVIRLTDGEHRDVFHRFCMDIVEATRPSHSEEEAVERFLIRTWRWHHLLRGGRDGRLNKEEQKGLMGELYILEHHLVPAIGPADAVSAWVGPLDAPKDFQVGRVGIESKAYSPLAPKVNISSAEQLDTAGTARLFLHVVEISSALWESTSVTIADVASRVRNTIASHDISAVIQFDERLNATGFDWNDDYSDNPLFIGDAHLYEVLEEFPRITSPMVHSGVEDVRYSLILSRCEPFTVDMKALTQALSGEADES